MTLDLVALGEVMLELSADGPLAGLPALVPSAAGDTFNVVAVAAGLGLRTGYVGVIGDDGVGDAVVASARSRGVDLSGVRRVPGRTGLYLVTTDDKGERSFSYYRDASAAGALSSDMALGCPAAAVHVSGITLAVSASARTAGLAALATARERGAFTSYDVNFRPALATSETACRDAGEAAAVARLLCVSLDEAGELAGARTAAEAVAWGRSLGAAEVLVGEGGAGATLGTADGALVSVAAPEVGVVDTSGAGDALVAGYLAARLAGSGPEACLRLACAAASWSVQARGALGTVPTAADAHALAAKVRLR